MRAFKTVDGGWASQADPQERAVLRAQAHRAAQIMADGRFKSSTETLAPSAVQLDSERRSEADILTALDFQPAPTSDWEETALQRIFPSATAENPAASALVRATYGDALRRRKVERMQTLETELTHPSGPHGAIFVPAGQEEEWLGAINDLRLVYSARLGFENDHDVEQLRQLAESLLQQGNALWQQEKQTYQRIYDYSIYELLTWWQETLLLAVMND